MRSAPFASFAALVLALGVPACGSCGADKPPPASTTDAAAAAPPPVPAPDGLLAEVWLRSPDALWARIQNGVSGAAALLPPDTGALVIGSLGLDPQVAALVDGKATAFAIVADEPGGSAAGFGWAAAIPLKDAPRFASVLLDGDAARFTAREQAGMRVLAHPDKPLAAACALAGRWLVVARDEADLERLGPYAWRTMPTRPAPASPASIVATLPAAAVAGPLAARLSSQWTQARAWLSDRDREQRASHGGRPPDFGDPQAILAAADTVVKRRVALLSGARGASVEIEAGDADVSVELRLQPGPDEAGAGMVASMHPGDARPLAEGPGDAVAGVLVRDDPAARAGDARELEAALATALGPRVTADDSRALSAALDDWAASRGDWIAAGVAWGPQARGVWMRTPADAGSRAVREMVDLLRRPAFGDPLRSLGLRSPAVGPATIAGLSDATLANLGPLGIAWAPHDGQLLVAAGDHAPQLLGTAASPTSHLGDDARVARALSAVGANATFVLLAMPLRLDAAKAGTDAARAPAVLAWGRRDADLWLRADVADELLREIVRLQAGL